MNLEDYLIENVSNQRDIDNTTSFYDKFNKLLELYNQNTETNVLLRSEGKYNSKICFIFKDRQHFMQSSEYLKRIMNVYNIEYWDILIFFENKFPNQEKNVNILCNEILIVDPLVLYIFDDNDLTNRINQEISRLNKIVGFKIINVNNIQSLINNNASAKIFDLFEYLLSYNY